MHWFYRTPVCAISVLVLCLAMLPACSGEESGERAKAPAGDGQATVETVDMDAVVEKARNSVERLRLTLAAGRDTKIEILGASPGQIPGIVVLDVRVTREGRTAKRLVPVTPDLKYVIAGAILPLGKIPRQRVLLENVDTTNAAARGSADAEITIVEYSDFQCPYCRAMQPLLARALREYEGKLRLVYKHFPLRIHEWAWDGSLMAECARKQNSKLFWKLHDYYYSESEKITRDNVLSMTQEALGGEEIDIKAFTKCYLDEEFGDYVRKSIDEGRSIGVAGTPVFLVNDVFLSGAFAYEILNAVILEELGEDWLDEGE